MIEVAHSTADFIAHRRESDGAIQSVKAHSLETGDLASCFATAIGLPHIGRVIGLCHDLGKYSKAFQEYIRDVTGMNGEAAQAAAKNQSEKVDHATSGAQLAWRLLPEDVPGRMLAQILSVCLMSHHSRTGIIDFITLEGKMPFTRRLHKRVEDTHLEEILAAANRDLLREIEELFAAGALREEFAMIRAAIQQAVKPTELRHLHFALLTRFLFSCLIDADRTNTADFENTHSASFRRLGVRPDWVALVDEFEDYLTGFNPSSDTDRIRGEISMDCLTAASRERGIHTLSVPTGGGKTLASLRFALHHALAQAKRDGRPIERIIYVLPYTTIIEQNAAVVRRIFKADVVLEHHSNLVPERDDWRNRVLSENWDAPIVFTTSVQVLNALFDHPTSAARRMHQLANAILIFDEIQTLPIKTVHLFNNAINFLVAHAGTSAVFCTATQPLLGEVDPAKGAARILPGSEIARDVEKLFQDLRRTTVTDMRRPGGWSYDEAAAFAEENLRRHGNLLLVVNTKDAAHELHTRLKRLDALVVHLSTHMCPAHRKARITDIRDTLNPQSPTPLVCVSTQLIEAGVDLDFSCVIRSLAGFDSLVQAGGRCNRNGRLTDAPVHVLNLSQERLGSLREIQVAQSSTERVLDDYRNKPEMLSAPKAIQAYFRSYFFDRAKEMAYPLKAEQGSPTMARTSLWELHALNPLGAAEYKRIHRSASCPLRLRQALSTASQAFRVIDAPTQGIVVPYGEGGRSIIADLASAFATEDCPLRRQIELLRQAQQFTVNVFPHTLDRLIRDNALFEVQPGATLFALREPYYDSELGVTHEALASQTFLNS